MANNEYALLWARQVRGLTIAEHAVLSVMAGFYDRSTGRCRIQLGHLEWRFEASRVYIRQIVHAIAGKGFCSVEPQFDTAALQDTNSVRLHVERWFPVGPGHDLGMRLLKSHIRDIATDSQLAKGFSEAWVEELPKRHGKKARPILYVAVNSPAHFDQLRFNHAALYKKLKGVAPFRDYQITAVKTFIDRRSEDGVLLFPQDRGQ